MKLLPRLPATIAGLLSFLSAILILHVWYILLFVATPSKLSVSEAAIGHLQYFFSIENPTRLFFVWLAALPLFSIAIGVAYLFKFADSKTNAVLLFASTIGLGLAELAFHTWDLALFVALPAIWGWRCVRVAQPTIRADA